MLQCALAFILLRINAAVCIHNDDSMLWIILVQKHRSVILCQASPILSLFHDFSSFITDEFALFLSQIECLWLPEVGRLCGNVEYCYVPVASLLVERECPACL